MASHFQNPAVSAFFRNVKLIITLLLFAIVLPAFSANNVQKFDSLANEISKIQSAHQKKTNLLIDRLYEIAYRHSDSLKLLPKCIYWEASTNYVQSNNDSALLSKCKAVLNMLDARRYPFEWALSHLALGLHYTIQGDYAEAFIASLHALECFKKLNDTVFIAKTLISLGDICTYIRSFKMAEDYFSQASLFVRSSQFDYYQILSGWAKIFFMLQQPDRSIDTLSEMIFPAEQQKDTARLVNIYLNLGSCYHLKNEPDIAYQYYMAALDWMQKIDNSRLQFSLYQNLATYYAAYANDFQKAVYYYRLAKNVAMNNNNNVDQLSYVYYGLAMTFEKFNNADSAYFYLKLNNELKDRLTGNSKTIESYRAYISVILESSQKELKIAEQAVMIKKRQFLLVVFLSIGISLVVVLLLIIMQQKRRTMTKQIEQNKDIQRLQEEKIALQTRELTSHALLLSEKNDILQQISERTRTLPDHNHEVEEIRQILKNNLTTDHAWESFMLHFGRVHPSFFERLKAHTAELTESNLRLCAYFRIGLSTKEVAQILNTTVGAVKRSRNRLKNKMGLEEKDNLDDFLRNV